MKHELVTVFMPAYNVELYIKEALDSIINQTYTNLEILIIDDGSTDRTLEIIKGYTDSRIRVIKNEKNMGLHYTRNLGIKEARGKYLALMDSDDISELNRIEKQVKAIESDSNIDVVTSHSRLFNGNSKRVLKTFRDDEELKISLIFLDAICNPATMIRLDRFRKLGIEYDAKYFVAEDYEMWAQVSKIGKFHVVDDVLLNYRYGHQNITKKSMQSLEQGKIRKNIISSIHNDLLDFYNFNLGEYEKEAFNMFFDDNPLETIKEHYIETFKVVVNKLRNTNIENNIFGIDKFNRVLDICIMKQLRQHDLSLKNKISIYKSLIINKLNTEINIELAKTLVRCIIKNK